MFPMFVAAAEAQRLRTDLCSTGAIVVATTVDRRYGRGPAGRGITIVTLAVDRTIVGNAFPLFQVRYAGDRSTRVSETPDLVPGERYLLAFNVSRADSGRQDLDSWALVPSDLDLPDGEALHFALDAACARGPVFHTGDWLGAFATSEAGEAPMLPAQSQP